ncbi:putative ribonuclease H-like domain-containing protein [Tanacetum coccineum]
MLIMFLGIISINKVYVCQPPGFEDPDFPNRVYKVENALYGLHQAPRAWYETLSTYLLKNGFQRGHIDKTLFIKRDQGDIDKTLCIEFEKMMHKKFQMSSIGELTFFLGLQVKQKEDGIFISQDKYMTEILKKFGFSDVKTANTPIETHKPLLKDADGEDVNEYMYRLMIGSLMYLTSSRPDIIYLKGQPKLGLRYPKDLPFDLVAYTDSDYAGASLDRKSTIGGIGVNAGDSNRVFGDIILLKVEDLSSVAIYDASSLRYALTVNPTICTSCIKQFWSTVKAKMVYGEVQLQALVDGKKIVVTEASVRRDLQLEDANGILLSLMEIPYSHYFAMPKLQVLFEYSTRRDAIHNRIYIGTLSYKIRLFANIRRQGKRFFSRRENLISTMVVQARKKWCEGSAIPTDPQHTPTITQPSSSQPQKKHKSRKFKMKDTQIPQSSVPSENLADEAVNEENVSKHSNDPLLSTAKIDSLKRRVKKLEKKQRPKTHGLKRLYKVGLSAMVVSSKDEGLGDEDASKQGRKIHDINADEDITLENVHDEDIFGVNDLDGDEVVVESEVADKDVNLSVDEVSATSQRLVQDKGKGKMNELEPMKKLSKNDQLRLDEELAFRLRVEEEEEEEERIAREKAQQIEEANTVWDDIQAKVEVDY